MDLVYQNDGKRQWWFSRSIIKCYYKRALSVEIPNLSPRNLLFWGKSHFLGERPTWSIEKSTLSVKSPTLSLINLLFRRETYFFKRKTYFLAEKPSLSIEKVGCSAKNQVSRILVHLACHSQEGPSIYKHTNTKTTFFEFNIWKNRNNFHVRR